MANDQTFNLNLVKEIEKHPCLYNYTMVGYSFKDVSDKAWNDVSEAVQLSVNECRERWKNLRAVYVRHKKYAKNGMGTRKPYYLEEAMEFTLPYIKTLNPTSAYTSSTASNDTIYDDQDEDTKPLCQIQSPETNLREATPPPQGPLNNQSSKKRPNEENNDFPENLTSKISKITDSLNPQKDANTLFLLSLLPDLNEMSSQQIRTFKKKVLDLIDNILVPSNTVKVEPITD
ncbi:uncharacterized protein LOC120631555 isoform X2 [Pararge aegeria]|uniref:Jg4558 protein n=1 Tax=Pararge aegeria aegeria TaxID=348720 RepID=A0A8S4RQH2_9NEOP|nr:uncharacterized protein LOC120631555 isoform X2 [Pararge aegeria]CAH2239872.1 jg4558 [Pararge aegeria aegeria]